MADPLGITEKVRSVAQMGRQELVSEWQSHFGAPPSPKLRMALMRPVLIYRIQENAYGLSVSKEKSRVQNLAANANRRLFKTGTKIISEWRGQLHEVVVTAEGYVYNGEVYGETVSIRLRFSPVARQNGRVL